MKKIMVSVLMMMALSSNIYAGVWDSSKEYANKAMFWKSKHLEDVSFSEVYPKALYKKSYVGIVMTGSAIVGAGAFTYFTAGTGAPAAAAGVSGVASWVGGGAAGSYMAGLSTIGSWFGGNAMLGAAILNGISIGTAGAGSTYASLSILGKAGVMASVTATGMDGVAYFSNSQTKLLEYKIKVKIPKNLGDKKTRRLINHIYDTNDKINDALEAGDESLQKVLYQSLEIYNQDALLLLKHQLTLNDNQEDLLVLSILAWNQSKYKLFDQAISKIDSSSLENTGFLNYLYALQALSKGKTQKSLVFLDNAIDENPYAIEPVILYINLLGNSDFLKYEPKIELLVKQAAENYDSDKYTTGYSITGVYFRAATFYFNHKRYVKAKKYYTQAYDEFGFLQKNFFASQLAHTVQLGIANSLYAEGKTKSAESTFQSIISDIDEENIIEKEKITKQYLGTPS